MTTATPKENNMKRIATLDVLRGFALLGIILINIQQMVFTSGDYSKLDILIHHVLDAAVGHRFFTIFSFLFGVGFHLFLSRAEEKGERPRLLFLRRLLILFLFGLVHHYFQPGEALLYYAVIGLLLIPFYRARPSIVLSAGLILTAAGCYTIYPLLILGMFLMGLWAGKIGLFVHTERYVRGLVIVQIATLLLIVPFYYLQETILDRTGALDMALAIGGLPISAFYVTTLTLLMRRRAVQRLLIPLSYLGRMALTNYLMQTVIILTLASLLDWQGKVHMLPLMITAVLILAVQMLLSTLWLRHFRMGPLEYVWRFGTYGKASIKERFGIKER